MEEFLAALVGGFLELFGEVLLQVLLEALVGAVDRLVRRTVAEGRFVRPFLSSMGYLILGSMMGGLSLGLIPHRLARPTRFHGISLLISPLVTGLIMSQLGSLIRWAGKTPVQIESLGYGFAFALGIAAVRFAYFR